MRVVDLDRDMSDVIPTGTTRDSDFLFDRMTNVTLQLARPDRGRRILDVASGIGQDAIAMAERGAQVVAAEPSARMAGLFRMKSEESGAPLASVRGWSDALPFASGTFDAVICKGAIDHFDAPEQAIAEMARVTRPTGHVVLTIASYESLSCRLGRRVDTVRERWLGRAPSRGRRTYDVPSDHFTRYEYSLMREQASRWLELDIVRGVSLGWGIPVWSRGLERLPAGIAAVALRSMDQLAKAVPSLADVVVLAGRPRATAQSPTSSR